MYLKVTLWTKGGHKITGNMIGDESYDFDQRMQRVYANDAGPDHLIYLHDGPPDGPPIAIRTERIEAWRVLRVMDEPVIVDEDDEDEESIDVREP